MPMDGQGNQCRIGEVDSGQTEKLGEGLTNGVWPEIIGIPEYPFRFQYDGIGNKNVVLFWQRKCLFVLGIVIPGKKSHHYVRINCYHSASRLPYWLHGSARSTLCFFLLVMQSVYAKNTNSEA